MRILQVISTFYPAMCFGGPQRGAYEISRALAERGHEVEVYTTNAYDALRNFRLKQMQRVYEGFRVTYFPNFLRFGKVYFSPGMIFALRKELPKFDIVHIHFGRQPHDVAIAHYARRYGVPYVLQAHGSPPKRFPTGLKFIYDELFTDILLGHSSQVIALSKSESQHYRLLGIPRDKISIIPNAIDVADYDDLPSRGRFKSRYGIDEDKRIMLFLGRINWIKGLDILMNAYARLVSRTDLDNILLVIAGPDDGYLETTKSLIRELGLENSVIMTGPVYDRRKLEAYVDSEFLVLPSIYEAFATTVLEAYACNKPVIASDVESMSNIVLHMKTGLLYKNQSSEDLAKAIAYMFSHREEAMIMGANAHNFLLNNFTIERISGVIEDLYKSLLKGR
ncbi:glycosyltransferase [Candidatus Bathyarchaeota archaeon]|nr:glycosyltransferase [Candidatus Bathyarchaeota archaeon]